MARTLRRRTLLQIVGSSALLPWAEGQPLVTLPQPVRVGIVGLEGHFSEVLTAARRLPQIEITAVTMNSPLELERAATQPLITPARKYQDYRRMLDAEELDVVALCGRNASRSARLLECVERGLAVAAEKPLAVSLEQLKTIRQAVARAKVPLTMLLPMRFRPPYLAMKSLVESHQIGEPVALSAQKSYQLGERPKWMTRRSTFGGSIPYVAVHPVDLLRFVSGREMVETAAFHSRVGFPELDEMENNAALIYRLDNGGTANIRLDFLRPKAAPSHGDDRLRLAGTRGVVEYKGGSLTLVTDGKEPHEITQWPQHPGLFEDFLDSIYNGKEHHLSKNDIYRVTEIVLKSRQAADTDRVVGL